MRELIKLDQEVLIVPKDFKLTNIGKVVDVGENGFKMKVNYPTQGININHICEFFSPTENGMLYFESYTAQMENNILTIANPIKHRFLQRRKFTRIPFLLNTKLYRTNDVSYDIQTIDLSAGGLKFRSKEHINIDTEYNVDINLSDEQLITCKIQLIRIEKQDDGTYVLSGRFLILNNIDKMTLIQYCMKKNMEFISK
ncbi:PilZ domain-containing protein [bacterium]|nr:PilZ domain-containing protein [bacterium]